MLLPMTYMCLKRRFSLLFLLAPKGEKGVKNLHLRKIKHCFLLYVLNSEILTIRAKIKNYFADNLNYIPEYFVCGMIALIVCGIYLLSNLTFYPLNLELLFYVAH